MNMTSTDARGCPLTDKGTSIAVGHDPDHMALGSLSCPPATRRLDPPPNHAACGSEAYP